MQKYELLYVLGGDLTDEELAPHRERLEKVLTDAGATILRNEYAGKVKLAYPIAEHRYGHYVVVWFDAEPAAISKMSNLFTLDADLVRHMIVSADEVNPLTATFQLQVKEEPPRPREERVDLPVRDSAPTIPAVELSPEDLDKKIDEILTEEIK